MILVKLLSFSIQSKPSRGKGIEWSWVRAQRGASYRESWRGAGFTCAPKLYIRLSHYGTYVCKIGFSKIYSEKHVSLATWFSDQNSFLMKIIAKSAFFKTICQFFATTYFFVVPITGPSMYLSFYDDVQVPGVYQAPGPGPQPDLQLGHWAGVRWELLQLPGGQHWPLWHPRA